MPKREIEISFPFGGLSRRLSYQNKPPFYTERAINVRPRGTESLRLRGGSRPMLEKTHATQLGGGTPIRLLNTILALPANTTRQFVDEFTTNGAADVTKWASGSWFNALAVYNGGSLSEVASNPSNTEDGVVAILTDPIDTTKPYTLSGGPGWNFNHTANTLVRFYIGLDNSSPNGTQNCVYAEYRTSDPSGPVHTLSLHEVRGGVDTVLQTFSEAHSETGTILSVNVDGNTVVAKVTGTTFSMTITKTVNDFVGQNIAIGLQHAGSTTSVRATIARFQIDYQEAVSISPNMLCASAGGEFYYENASNVMTAEAGSMTLASDHGIQSVDRLGILYIADWSDSLAQGVATAVGGSTPGVITNGRLDSSTYADWTTLGIDADDHVVEVTDVTGAFAPGVYPILDINASSGLSLASTTDDASDCSFRVLRGPKKFTSSTVTLAALAASTGVIPVGCRLVAVYNDRLVWAGNDSNEVFASRQGDPLDYNYGASDLDVGRAWSDTVGDITKIAEPTVALIACSSDYLIFGCSNTMWMLVGDATNGGQIVNLSRTVGIVGPNAWCHGPEGQIVFLSRGGLYGLPPGASAYPELLQGELPDDLRDIDPTANEILLEYDVADQGVHIYVTPIAPGITSHFWLDWPTKTFTNTELVSDHEPTAITVHRNSGSQISDVVLGCRDGYLRRFSRTATDDDGVAMNSSVLLGPISTGDGLSDGMISEIVGKLSAKSGDVNWAILSGVDHEDCVGGVDQETGTWHAGLNASEHVRVRGASIALRIDATGPWELEQIMATIDSLGRQRVA